MDVDRRAAALLAGIQGGVSLMMSTGSSAHLRAALDSGIEQLRSERCRRAELRWAELTRGGADARCR